MKSRLLLFFTLLLLLIAAMYAGFIYFTDAALRAQLDAFKQQLEKQGYEVLIEDPVIERSEGIIKTNNVYLNHPEKQHNIYIDHVEIQVSTRDVLRFMMPFSEGLSSLQQIQLQLSQMKYRQEARGTGFDFDFMQLSLKGDIEDLAQSAISGFDIMPSQQQELTGRVLNFKAFYDTKLTFTSLKIPFPEVSRLFFDLAYHPEDDFLDVRQAEISAFDALMSLDGRVQPLSLVPSAFKEDATASERRLELHAELTHEDEDTLHIGADGFGLSFDLFQVAYEGLVVPGKGLRHSLFSDEVRVETRVENLMLRSPQTFRSTYGQPLRFLGLSPDGLRIEGIALAYSIQGDRAEITSFEVANPYADINFVGGLRYENTAENDGWNWENAGFRITPKTAESKRFIDSFSNFFGLQIPQQNPDSDQQFPTYELPLKGRMTTPELEL